MDAPPVHIAAAILAGGRATRYGGVAKGLLELWEPGPPGDHPQQSPRGRGSHTTIVARLVRVIRAARIGEIVICADDPAPYEHLGLPIIPDAVPDSGPLGGIAAALRRFGGEAGRYDGVLILPCDMPAITEREIGALVAAFRGPHATSSRAPRSSVVAPSPCTERGEGVRSPVGRRSSARLVVVGAGDEMQPLCVVLNLCLLDEVLQAIEARELAVGRLWRKLGGQLVRFADPAPFVNVNTPEEMAAWAEASRG